MKIKIDLEYWYNLLVVMMLAWFLLVTSSCGTSKIGCTPREERQATKHWIKGMNKCQSEMARQSAMSFPYEGSTETKIIYKEGKETIDTQYLTEIIKDTVYRTKLITKTKVDTVYKDKVVMERDKRVELILQGEINKLSDKDYLQVKKIAKQSQKIVIMAWSLGILSAIVALYLLVKFNKLRIPKF